MGLLAGFALFNSVFESADLRHDLPVDRAELVPLLLNRVVISL